MSDPFDPDAWPRSSGASSPRNNDDDDDFNPFAGSQQNQDDDYDQAIFGSTGATYGTQNAPGGRNDYDYGNSGNYGYNEDDDDYSTTGGAVAPSNTDWAAPTPTSRSAASGRANLDDDYRDEFDDDYDDYDTFGGNQNDYDDFDFDREPQNEGGGNGRRIAVIAAVVVIAGLLGAGLLTLFTGGDDSKDQASNTTTTEAPASDGASGDQDGGTNTTETTETTAPETTETTVDSTNTTGAGAQSQSDKAPKDVVDTLNAALTAWGKFAVDGNIDDVKTYFAPNTRQFNRFQLDAQAISANPPGGDPITVTMTNPSTTKTDDNNWTIRGTAVWARTGEVTQNFQWEIRMSRTSERQPWQITSVRQF